MIEVVGYEHRNDGAEDLLLGDGRVRFDSGEHGRFDKPSAGQVSVGDPFAAGQQLGPLLLADLDVLEDARALRFIDQGSDEHLRVQGVSNL